MSRPTWTADGFARRVLMGRSRLFLIVEGRVLDRAFYDRLLSANEPATKAGYEVYLIEQISVKPNATGGKKTALSLFDRYRRSHRLAQRNSRGVNSIVFALDRDFDDVCGSKRRSPHVFYTTYADVEAEVLINTDLPRALSTTLSITQDDSVKLTAELSNFAGDLAERWRDWIEICVLSSCLSSRCSIQPSQSSPINASLYGDVDKVKATVARQTVLSASTISPTPTRVNRIEKRVALRYSRENAALLVKGKWLPPYLLWRIKSHFQAAPIDYRSFERVILKAALDALDYSAPWAQRYHAAFSAIVA